MSSIWSLPPQDRASFATTARLLTCFVTESLLKAYFVPINGSQKHLVGAAVILSSRTNNHSTPYRPTDIFVVVPLRHIPIFKSGSQTEIGLLDPLDMLPYVYELHDANGQNGPQDVGKPPKTDHLAVTVLWAISQACCDTGDSTLALSMGPLHLWKKFADGLDVNDEMQEAVAEELSSSLAWQQHSYEHPPPQPTFDSPSIAWEQCIVEGHSTHPMHKARRTMAPISPIQPGEYDWNRPRVRFVVVPRVRMSIQGAWDDLLAPFREAATTNAGKPLDVAEDHVLVPVHELQIANIREKFPDANILPEEYYVDAWAQQSIRTVLVPSAIRSLSLKLALGIRLTSAMRTISPPAAFLGPRVSDTIVHLLTYDRSLLIVQRELASVSHVDPDPDVAEHLAGIVREAYENTSNEDQGEQVIICTALTEMGYGGEDEVPLVQIAFGLDTEEKRVAWLDRFVDFYLRAFLPPVIVNGLTFEAHPQNMLARFDTKTQELTGFLIRDLEGLRIHSPTLLASTGLSTLDSYIPPRHYVMADTLESVYTRLYQTLIHNHLQQLIRVLRLHYNGKGWEIVRQHLREQIPEGHALRKLWLSPTSETVHGNCFMSTRLRGMYGYRTPLYVPFSNLILYKGNGHQDGNADLRTDPHVVGISVAS